MINEAYWRPRHATHPCSRPVESNRPRIEKANVSQADRVIVALLASGLQGPAEPVGISGRGSLRTAGGGRAGEGHGVGSFQDDPSLIQDELSASCLRPAKPPPAECESPPALTPALSQVRV